LKKIFNFFIPASLLTRYVYVAMILFLILVGIAISGWYTVQRGVHQHHQHMKVLGELENAIHEYIVSYQSVKYATLEFMIQPDDEYLVLYKQSVEGYNQSLKRLDASQKKHVNDGFSAYFNQLKQDSESIHLKLEKIINVRLDAEKTFPFTSNMLLLANENIEVLSLIDRVLSMGNDQDESLSASLKLLMNDTRYAWVRLMAEYRLLVSVRFGLFTGDWKSAFNQRAYNISLLVDKIKNNLRLLEKQRRDNDLSFVVEHEVNQLFDLIELSLQRSQLVMSLLGADNWRQDLVLLKAELRPAFSRLDKSIQRFHEKEERVWSSSMGELTSIAQTLSDSLWILLFFCSLLAVLGYFMFFRAILLPIKNTAQALKDEAMGNKVTLDAYSSAIEIRNLTDAFYEMRKQVNSRQQRLLNILDNAAEAIITIDNCGVIETFNVAAEKLFAYQAAEVMGENVLMLIPQDERDYYQALFLDYQDNKSGAAPPLAEHGYEIDVLCNQQVLLPVSLKFSKTLIDGRLLYTGLVVDISERLANELERQQHLAEMAHIGRLSIMGEMAAGMAHELNQPLAAMSLYLQGSLRRCDPKLDTCKDITTAVKSAIGQVDRASDIIRKMRGFAHRESFHLEVVDINELIKKSVDLVLISQQSVSPQPAIILSDTPVFVNVDALQIEQVLVNLIRNAFEAQVDIEESERILIVKSECDDDGFARVYVIDAGEGVAEENIDKIFNTYFTTRKEGLGMGLSICRSIIEEHNGVLWYRAGVDAGAQFCFILPLVDIAEQIKN